MSIDLVGRLAWLDVTSTNIDASLAFYRHVFGWESQAMEVPALPGYRFLRTGATFVAGADPIDDSKGPPVWTLFVSVDDIDDTRERIIAGGGAVPLGPEDIHDLGRMAIARDATGCSFGLWQPRSFAPADTPLLPGGLVGGQLVTPDPAASVLFYVGCFGWTAAPQPDGSFVVDCGGIAAHFRNGHGARGWTPTLAVADIGEAVLRIHAYGGCVTEPAAVGSAGNDIAAADPLGAQFRIRAQTFGLEHGSPNALGSE